MRYLADTCAFLWFGTDDNQLPPAVKAIMEDPENNIRISIASLWEIAIKHSLGKMPLHTNLFGLEAEARALSIEILPITVKAIHETTTFSQDHKDPFDRIIAATAITEGDALLTCDSAFDLFGVKRIW